MEQFINITPEAERFLESWHNMSVDYIEARTSGSTGDPKLIYLPKHDMIVSAGATCRQFGIGRDSVMVCPLSADYIAGKMMIVRALMSGAKLYFEQPSNRPLAISTGMKSIDLVPIVPSQIEGLVGSPDAPVIRNVIIGGANIPAETERLLYNQPFRSFATYGMTETCSHVALREIRPDNDIYESMPEVEFRTDARGCLIIAAQRYSFGRILTNDIVELLDNRRFRWIGRMDNVINTGGLKVFPEEMERIIAPYIHAPFYFAGRHDSKWGERVVMLIENDGSFMLTDREVIELCKKNLPRHAVPKEVVFVSEFKRTQSGKIIRSTEF